MNDLANAAMRSIIQQAQRTRPDDYGIGYLRGSISIMSIYLEPDPELVAKAHAAVDELKKSSSTNQGA